MKHVSVISKLTCAFALVSLTGSVLAGCSAASGSATDSISQVADAVSTETAAAQAVTTDSVSVDSSNSTSKSAEMTATAELRIGSLKGPTTIGLLNLMAEVENGSVKAPYTFVMETDPSALSAKVVSGEVDVALVPANLASVLYNKTKGGVVALDINTLGVLDCVCADESVNSISDLSGKTVLMTGQGATPEYAMQYLLAENGVTDCTLTFAAEATEIAARLQEEQDLIAVLPQPFATAALMQNEALSRRFSLTDEWNQVSTDSALITGVTIIRKQVLDAIGVDEAEIFVSLQSASMAKALEDTDLTAQLAVQQEIIAKEPIAKAALPYCGLPTDAAGKGGAITGAEMERMLSGYLQTLFDADPASVGGTLPDEGFYFK